jgi:hypothetical protein
MEQSLKPKVTLVFGRICSGKGSYMKDTHRLVVSDIVKQIVSSTNRDVLQNSMHLDNRIAQAIIYYITGLFDQSYQDHIVVDGIRQVSIVDRVLETFPQAEMVWLEVPYDERKRRYEARKDVKDVESFELADNKAIELECQRIFDTFKDKLTIINNY